MGSEVPALSRVVLNQVGVLNSAGDGERLSAEVLHALGRHEVVEINAMDVERVTISFANAFVMHVLAVTPDAFRSGAVVIHASDFVRCSFEQSMDRFARGMRLTSQRHVPA
jgi:hypothetical protein